MSTEIAHPLLKRLAGLEPVTADRILDACENICVVSPHPDDETLGCGALLYEAAQRNIVCRVVCMTDGAASHVNSPTWSSQRLAEERHRELIHAVSDLTSGASIKSLGYPDGAVPGGGRDFDEAVIRLGQCFEEYQPSLIATTWCRDPHIDHQRTSRIVKAASQTTPFARYYEFPIWGRFLPDPEPDDFASAILLAVPGRAYEAKRSALSRHRTQMTRLIDDDPHGFVMEEWMQQHFLDHPEIYLAAS